MVTDYANKIGWASVKRAVNSGASGTLHCLIVHASFRREVFSLYSSNTVRTISPTITRPRRLQFLALSISTTSSLIDQLREKRSKKSHSSNRLILCLAIFNFSKPLHFSLRAENRVRRVRFNRVRSNSRKLIYGISRQCGEKEWREYWPQSRDVSWKYRANFVKVALQSSEIEAFVKLPSGDKSSLEDTLC